VALTGLGIQEIVEPNLAQSWSTRVPIHVGVCRTLSLHWAYNRYRTYSITYSQSWIVAYPGYTLQKKTLFPGWPVMVH